MTSPTRALRRAGAALAAAAALSATALGATAASATVHHPSAGRRGDRLPPACRASQLTGWMGVPGSGAAGTIFYELQFSNVSRASCVLKGFPSVRATSGGAVVGPPAVHDTTFRARPVVLVPHGTAHAVLGIAEAGNVCPGRGMVNANGLLVAPPRIRRSFPVNFGAFQVCRHRVTMHVRVLRPGTGIPGFSQ